jgi:hypothetical protein
MGNGEDVASGAVVFVCDRQGAALQRRERCLKLAGIPYGIHAEHRPSGTYYKLCVRESDAVAAHLALQMGGCGRSSRLKQNRSSFTSTLRDIAQTLWDEIVLLVGRVTDVVRGTAPLLLRGPTPPPPPREPRAVAPRAAQVSPPLPPRVAGSG